MALPIHLQPHRIRITDLSSVASGGQGENVESYAPVADNVPCLISQGSGRPDQRFEQRQGVTRVTVTGSDPRMASISARFEVLTGPHQGRTLRVVGVSEHGPGAISIGKYYRATCEVQQ